MKWSIGEKEGEGEGDGKSREAKCMHLFYVKITPNFDLFSVLITFKNKSIKKQCSRRNFRSSFLVFLL